MLSNSEKEKILLDLLAQNEALKNENDSLTIQIEEEKSKLNKNYTIKDFKDQELDKLKDDLEDAKNILKEKDKQFRETYRQYKSQKEKSKNIKSQIDEINGIMAILNEEYNKLSSSIPHSQPSSVPLSPKNDNMSEEVVSFAKMSTESEIEKLEKIKKEYDSLVLEETKLNEDISLKEKIFSNLCNEYAKLKKDIYTTEQKTSTNEKIFLKNKDKIEKINVAISSLRQKFTNNKSVYSSIEKNITKKLYFIRYSNSLVRSLFNIINTRRLQIEMLRSASLREIESQQNLFVKLNQFQAQLENNYYEYLSLIEAEDE